MSVKITEAEFESFCNQEEKTVLIDFYADWCGPCKMLAPVLAEIETERDDIVIGKVNVDEAPVLAAKFGVTSIPTVLIIRDGIVADTFVGYRDKASVLDLL